MRPVVKAGLRRLWRPGGALQVGVTPGRSLLLNGLGPAATRFVGALDGSRDIPGLLAHAEHLGLPAAQATTLLDVLARAGFLDDAGYDPGPALRALDPAETDRLAPDLAALALGYLVPGGAVRAMTRRRTAVVTVYGCGRVGASVAHLLAAAGVGCVVPVDAGRARSADAAPAGFRNPRAVGHRDEWDVPGPRRGRRPSHLKTGESPPGETPTGDPRRHDLVRALIRASAPATRTTLPANRQHPDLAVLAPVADSYPAQAAALQAAGVPHLTAEVHETTGVLGPFVQPGRTSCLRCRDLFRTARDPGWPRAMVPFGGVDAVPAGGDRACDVVLATQLAVLAAQHVLAFVEGDPPPTVNAVVEVVPPFGTQTRHERPAHPDCGCGAEVADVASAAHPPLVHS
ncbi:MAG: hypothetical protein HOW97_13010 [Catenulispora sp.]|nr:hypothetical protein [Catenulispora sp.]